MSGVADEPLHPSAQRLLGYFQHGHLREPLQNVVRPYQELAHHLVAPVVEGGLGLRGEEATVALRKLVESKDCAVRSALPPVG